MRCCAPVEPGSSPSPANRPGKSAVFSAIPMATSSRSASARPKQVHTYRTSERSPGLEEGQLMLKTELCERLGIEYPILSAGFGPAAGPDVVAAVSNAGGCGVLGASGFSLPYLRQPTGGVPALATRPFCVHPHSGSN